MFDVTFWVAIAFLLFVIATMKPIGRFGATTLDKRSARIKLEIDEALRLREEAQATLAAYQKKQREAHAEAETLLASAQETVRQMEAEARQRLELAVEARVKLAHEKIAREEQQLVADLKKKVVDLATEAAQAMFAGELNAEAHDRLIRLAVKDADRLIH